MCKQFSSCAKWFVLHTICLGTFAAVATVRYVAPAGSNIYPYTSWETAATAVQPAMDACAAGDEVLVTNGVYAQEGSAFDGGCVVYCSSNVILRSFNPHGAIINGAGVRRGVCMSDKNNVVLDGFVISNCYTVNGTGGRYRGGAAVYVLRCNNVTITNCQIVNNHSAGTDKGGGIYIEESGANRIVTRCLFRNNTSLASGGGIATENGAVIDACAFYDNYALYGGGVYMFSTGVVRNCLIAGNTAKIKAGGAYMDYDAFIAHNTSTKTTLENCTVAGNYAPDVAGVVFARQAQVVNSIIYDNKGVNCTNYIVFSYTNTCSYPLPRGVNNSSNEPVFLSAAVMDFRLATNSPCRNTGLNQPWMTGALDVAGNGRITEGIVDRGCYELGVFVCNFRATPRQGFAPLTTVFSAVPSGTNIENVTYYWDFDADGACDAAGAGLATVTNDYPAEGRYAVRLVATNAAGASAGWLAQDCIYVFATNIHYVAPTGSNVFPYTSWETAATNLSDAVAAAVDGHVVLCTNGEYFLATELVIAHNIRVTSVNGRDATILTGNAAAKKRCVYVNDVDAVLDGLTLSNGNVFSNGDYGQTFNGGGVYFNRRGALLNARVTRCQAVNGGGVYMYLGGMVSNCIVTTNMARQIGGGVECGIYGQVLDCEIAGNVLWATWAGAGVGVESGADALIANCSIHDNKVFSTVGGGGIYFEGDGLVSNCVLYNNMAVRNAAGIHYTGPGSARFTGCVISNNFSDLSADGAGQGGGIYMYGGGILENSIICNNFNLDGGGIMAYNHFNAPFGFLITNCTIYGNRAANVGGGIAATTSGTPDLYAGRIGSCRIYDNWALNSAGGATLYDGNYMFNCVLSNNHCASVGGGLLLYYYGTKSVARNCLIVNNVSSNVGGGVYFYYGSAGTYAENCTVVGNRALLGGGGLYFNSGGSISNSIVYYNTPDNWAFSNTGYRIRYSCTTPRPSGTTYGNITNAPQFVDTPAGNYQLQHGSPCVNAGRNMSWMTAGVDYANQPRLRYGTVDMGAYEVQDLAPLWCDFSASVTNPLVDDTVTFTASVDGTSSLAQLSYVWDYDVASGFAAAVGSNITTYAYGTAGVFSVNLVVSNQLHVATNCLKTGYITVVPEPIFVFTFLIVVASITSRQVQS